jgi:hypothetical protein
MNTVTTAAATHGWIVQRQEDDPPPAKKQTPTVQHVLTHTATGWFRRWLLAPPPGPTIGRKRRTRRARGRAIHIKHSPNA